MLSHTGAGGVGKQGGELLSGLMESFKRLLSRVLKASSPGCKVSFQLRQQLLYFFIPIAVPLQLLCNNLSIINRALCSSHLETVHSLYFKSIKFPLPSVTLSFHLKPLSDCLQATSSSSVCISLDVWCLSLGPRLEIRSLQARHCLD